MTIDVPILKTYFPIAPYSVRRWMPADGVVAIGIYRDPHAYDGPLSMNDTEYCAALGNPETLQFDLAGYVTLESPYRDEVTTPLLLAVHPESQFAGKPITAVEIADLAEHLEKADRERRTNDPSWFMRHVLTLLRNDAVLELASPHAEEYADDGLETLVALDPATAPLEEVRAEFDRQLPNYRPEDDQLGFLIISSDDFDTDDPDAYPGWRYWSSQWGTPTDDKDNA